MLPTKSFQQMFYPMTAEIYFPRTSQNDFGEIEKSWEMDRVIRCSVIKENPRSKINEELMGDKFLTYNQKAVLRTDEDIFQSIHREQFRLTDVLVTNIKDEAGNFPWRETADKPTNFEVSNVEPMYDELHNVMGYRILLVRSSYQGDIDVFY